MNIIKKGIKNNYFYLVTKENDNYNLWIVDKIPNNDALEEFIENNVNDGYSIASNNYNDILYELNNL